MGMGYSTNSNVAFICTGDESGWAQPFLDEIKKPAAQGLLGHKAVNVNGAGDWEEAGLSVPVATCEVLDDGKTIIISSEFFGLINPARMDLPVSLKAVVYQSRSCQAEEQDPVYAVRAENVRQHNFSDTADVNRPAWFDYDKKLADLSEALESMGDDEGKEGAATDGLWQAREDAFPNLISKVKQLDDLETPFVDNPEVATVMGFLKSIDHEEAEEELGFDFDGTPEYPCWDYTNAEIILGNFAADITPELQELINKGVEIQDKEKAERDKFYQQFTPTQTGLSQAEFVDALKTALAGGEDVTGIARVIQNYQWPHMDKLSGYIIERLESPTSPVGQKLREAKTGEEVYLLVDRVRANGRWTRFELPGEQQQQVEEDDLEGELEGMMDNCEFEEIASRAEELKEVILANIKDFAANFDASNPYYKYGTEPQWLLEELKKAGAVFIGGEETDTYQNYGEPLTEEEAETTPAPEPEPETARPVSEFAGKRVCVTGKLEETRDAWEYFIKEAGGKVASGVSKTTDFLIAGEDAGSKLDKAKELNINILNEGEAIELLGEYYDTGRYDVILQKNYIDELVNTVEVNGEGYYRITLNSELEILIANTLEELKDRLILKAGIEDKGNCYLYSLEELKTLKVERVTLNTLNNVTAVYYDNECGTVNEPNQITLNTIEDARAFCEFENSSWGGHLSTLRVITKQGNKITSQLGDEAEFPEWSSDYEYIRDTYENDEELLAIVGGPEAMDDLTEEELKDIIREGRWPIVKQNTRESNRQQLDAMLLRLEAKSKKLLEAKVWDEVQIEVVAALRSVFTQVIGKNDQAIENYLSLNYGCCGFTEEEQAQGIPFQADQWESLEGAPGFMHDYIDNSDADLCEAFLPDGWIEVPRYEFDFDVKPTDGEKLLELVERVTCNDLEELLDPDLPTTNRTTCGEALVVSGYLSNQQNLQDDKEVVLKAFQSFSKALTKALDAS